MLSKILRHKESLMELSPVKTTLRIALVGDYNPDVIAH